MGKAVKSLANRVVNAPQTAFETAKESVKASVNLGKAAVGANGGNYFEGLKDASARSLVSGANVGITGMTGGMTSINDPSKGGNNLDTQIAKLTGKSGGGDLQAPDVPTLDNTEDPNLKAELENSKKKGRASTILAGGSDSIGSTSAKKTLLGSL